MSLLQNTYLIPVFFFLLVTQGCAQQSVVQSSPPVKLVPSGECTIDKNSLAGTTYQSQKIEFSDPVSGNTIWRLTNDGAEHAVTHSLQDQSGRETYQWSPDGTKICYAKTGHPWKPDGFYFVDVLSGTETYVGPGSRSGACAFGKLTNELFVGYGRQSNTVRESEVRGYDLSSFNCRVVTDFPEGYVGQLTLNSDGSHMGIHLITGPPGVWYGDDRYTFEYVILDVRDSSILPNWQIDNTPDENARGDAFYWHLSDPDYVRAVRNGELGIWNIHTLERIPASSMTMVGTAGIPSAHGCWSADGQLWFWSNGHVDCHPRDFGTELATRIVIERNGALYFSEIWNFLVSPDNLLKTERPPPWDANALLALTYSANASHFGHPHTQFSSDGKYVAFISDMGNTLQATPPGGVNPGANSTDLFVVVMP
jgi:hypothetical protein